RIDFLAVLGKTWPRLHAAGFRVFTSANCSVYAAACRRAEAVDTQFLAGLGFVRGHTAAADTRVPAGSGEVESAGYLSLCRRLRCHGPSPARHDPRLWRSGFVRTLQVAIHFRAAVSAGGMRCFFLVGSQGNSLGGFLLGRLARIDA